MGAEIKPASHRVIALQQFLEHGIGTYDSPLFDATQWLPLRRRSELMVFLLSWLAIGVDAAKPGRQSFQQVADLARESNNVRMLYFSIKTDFGAIDKPFILHVPVLLGFSKKGWCIFIASSAMNFPNQRLRD